MLMLSQQAILVSPFCPFFWHRQVIDSNVIDVIESSSLAPLIVHGAELVVAGV
jgi:hypothetical protein